MSKEIKEPKCKTCGDTREVSDDGEDLGGVCGAAFEISDMKKPCPDCTEQPPAGEFTKEIRRAIKTLKPADWNIAKIAYLGIKSEELCARLDRSEASRKELLTALRDGLIGISEASVKFERRFRHKGQAMLKKTFRILEAAKEKEVKI